MVRAAREEARWVVARQVADELAAEAGVTDEDLAWAASMLGIDADGCLRAPVITSDPDDITKLDARLDIVRV
jgi:hypothetical protein